MKVRIILRAKKDFGTMKVGETMTLINEVFDAMTGIAFYPIEREQWALIGYDLSTGKINEEGKEIFGNDILKGKLQYENSEEYPLMVVEWNKTNACFEPRQINGGKYTCPISWITNAELVGNVYENENLLTS